MTGTLRTDALLEELAQLRIANAEREQEMACLKALQTLVLVDEDGLGDHLQRMVELVPYGFLSPNDVRAQVRISELVFSTPGFHDSNKSHSIVISWAELEVGTLLVQITGPAGKSAPIPREKQLFLSLVADRFGECIQGWGMLVEAERSKQRVSELDQLNQELEEVREIMRRLRVAVEQLSAYTMQIWDGVVFVSLAGILDSCRAAQLMEKVFTSVVNEEPYFFIIDIQGVDVIDTMTAGYIIRILKGVRLLGITGIITGVQPTVAETIVIIGIPFDSIRFHGTLRDGLQYCIRQMKAIRRREKLQQTTSATRPERKS